MVKQHSIKARFLQSLSVMTYGFLVYLHPITTLVIMFLLFSNYWPLVPLFVFWTWYDKETPYRGGRPSNILKYFPTLRYFREYFPMGLVKTVDLDPNKNYIFVSSPHGFLGAGNYGNFLIGYSPREELFPGLKFYAAVLDFNLHFPILRDITLSWGTVSSSSKSLKYLLSADKKGNVVTLLVGGADEVKYTKQGEYKIVLNKRKGFIKLAMTTGCSLVPVINYGENDVYSIWSPSEDGFFSGIVRWVKLRTGITYAIPIGRSGLLMSWPKRMPITTVVGKPIELPKVAEPTQEEIDHYHSVYIEELTKLFNEHKHKYVEDPENTHLIIVE